MSSLSPELLTLRNDLLRMGRAELSQVLANGHPIDMVALSGPYRGVSLGLGKLLEAATWKTFRKRFWLDESTGEVVGHNERMRQTGVDGASEPEVDKKGRPITFGPFLVRPLPEGGTPFKCKAGLLLDYGARHPAFHPLSRLRDPLVAVIEGSTSLLLGASYIDLIGSMRTPSFFTLERESPLKQINW